mgnify:CR=1 FL=1
MEKVILIDGNNILFRSYYATAYNGNTMKNSKGFPTNALYGLVNMMNKIIAEENPTHVMVAFDKGKTFRHDKYDTYKDGRSETPDELKLQFPKAKELVEAMGINYFEIDNYEADDIIGTFAKKCNNNEDFNAVIISSDKDLLQLITDEVEVKLLKQVGNIRMTKEEFINTYGIEPPRMVDLKALMGDSSDNIPGVKGIGEKTAISLLKEYGTLDNLYNNIDTVKGKVKDKLIADKDSAYMSYDLATIYTDVPIDTDFEKIRYKGYDSLKYIELLEEFEFYSLIKKLDIKKEDIRENINIEEDEEIIIVDDISKFKVEGNYSIYLEILGYNYHKSNPLGISIFDGKNNYYIPFDIVIENKEIILENKYEKYTYDLKKLLVTLKKHNLEINNCNYDLMIAGYLLNYNIKDDISYLMRNNGNNVLFYEEEFGTLAKLKCPELDVVAKNACKKAKYIYETREDILSELEKEDAMYLFNSIEMPLVNVLADMESTGIKVDVSYLENMGLEIKEKLDLIDIVYEVVDSRIPISSKIKDIDDLIKDNIEFSYNTFDKEVTRNLINELANNPEKYAITCHYRDSKNWEEVEKYSKSQRSDKFGNMKEHSYKIEEFVKDENGQVVSVILENPWNSKVKIIKSLEDFLNQVLCIGVTAEKAHYDNLSANFDQASWDILDI